MGWTLDQEGSVVGKAQNLEMLAVRQALTEENLLKGLWILQTPPKARLPGVRRFLVYGRRNPRVSSQPLIISQSGCRNEEQSELLLPT